MIKLDRHANPDFSVINISAFVLTLLNEHYSINYDELLEKVVSHLGVPSKENYPYALNFLYLLGKLNYDQKNDSFRLRTNNETK